MTISLRCSSAAGRHRRRRRYRSSRWIRCMVDNVKMSGGGAPFELRGRIENKSDALLKSDHAAGHATGLLRGRAGSDRLHRAVAGPALDFDRHSSRRGARFLQLGVDARRRARASEARSRTPSKSWPRRAKFRRPRAQRNIDLQAKTSGYAADIELLDRRLVRIFCDGGGVAGRALAGADLRQQHLRVGRHHHRVHAGVVHRLSGRRTPVDERAERAQARADPDRRRAHRVAVAAIRGAAARCGRQCDSRSALRLAGWRDGAVLHSHACSPG